MSLICLCLVTSNNVSEKSLSYVEELDALVKNYDVNYTIGIDWEEPASSYFPEKSFVISITDGLDEDNCEKFLLPDGWLINGKTNNTSFSQRMRLLEEISSFLKEKECVIEWFIGQSGTLFREYADVSIDCNALAEYLTGTAGVEGFDNSVHVRVL